MLLPSKVSNVVQFNRYLTSSDTSRHNSAIKNDYYISSLFEKSEDSQFCNGRHFED